MGILWQWGKSPHLDLLLAQGAPACRQDQGLQDFLEDPVLTHAIHKCQVKIC